MDTEDVSNLENTDVGKIVKYFLNDELWAFILDFTYFAY